MDDLFDVERTYVPNFYLLQSHDVIQAAHDRDVENAGWLAGVVVGDEAFVIGNVQHTFSTIGHEAAHLALLTGYSWVNEGIAELIGSMIGKEYRPDYEVTTNLLRRSYLRRAMAFGNPLTVVEMLDWEWAYSDRATISLFYSQSRWFVQYLVDHHGVQDLDAFVDSLLDGEEIEAAFSTAYQADIHQELVAFLGTVLSDPLPEEYIADSLVEMAPILVTSAGLTDPWNQLISSGDFAGWLAIAQQYDALAVEVGKLNLAPAVTGLQNKYIQAFELLAGAAHDFAPGTSEGIYAGNAKISEANRLMGEAADELSVLRDEYPWALTP